MTMPASPKEKIECPWCGGFGWLDADQQPSSPDTGVGPCSLCNGEGTLCPNDMLELRSLARDAVIILGADSAQSGSRWPSHTKLRELIGPDPRRDAPTATELSRWWSAAQ